jgi:hypothetical protein
MQQHQHLPQLLLQPQRVTHKQPQKPHKQQQRQHKKLLMERT